MKESKRKKDRALKSKSSRSGSFLPAVLPEKVRAQIHRKASLGCRRAWDTAAELEQTLTVFYEEDQPAYHRWYKESCSELLKEQESASDKFREVADLLYRVNREAEFSDISMTVAYLRVTAAGYVFTGNAESDTNFSYGTDSDEDSKCDCELCRESRDSTVDPEGDTYQDEGPDEEFEEQFFQAMAEDLFEGMYGEGFLNSRQGRRAFESFRRKFAEESGYSGYRGFKEGSKTVNSGQTESDRQGHSLDQKVRCVTLYRLLVKQLHPDKIKVQTRLHRELWQMAQQAYAQMDLPQLEKVRILLSMLLGSGLDGVAVYEIKATTKELQHKNNEIRREIRQIKKNGMWGFTRLGEADLQQIQRNEQQKIRGQIVALRIQLQSAVSFLEVLKREAASHKESSDSGRSEAR